MTPALDGILVIDKPAGMTSHDVVAAVRRRLPRGTKVGHTGTLDPFATGVLPIVIGRATRLAQFFTSSHKRYTAIVAFGMATDTGDGTGTPVETAHDAAAALSADVVRQALPAFEGRQLQTPPAHSAKKVDGERAYALARRGDAVSLPAVEVTAHAVTLVAWDAEAHEATLDVDVSAGYYVRSLARDLGVALGVPAHLRALRRTASGEWTLEDACELPVALDGGAPTILAHRRPLSSVLHSWPSVAVDASQIEAVVAGRALRVHAEPEGGRCQVPDARCPAGSRPDRIRLVDASGDLVALGRLTDGGGIHADIVLRTA
ncbi:MAG: tRNA pseudouridine(55) synthase TruB [Acidobacteria bacterium]|nr:tRNA pseudouridine(55) synthase TruB [Acidobacteriota bacterium]